MTNAIANAAPKKKRGGASLQAKKQRAGYIFVLPFVIGLLMIYIPILWNSVWVSFNVYQTVRGGGYVLEFVGLENYSYALFSDSSFVAILTSGIQQLIINIPAIVIFALFMAVILNTDIAGRAAFRAIFFVPVILSTGLIGRMDAANRMLETMNTTTGINTGATENATSRVSQIINAVDFEAIFSSMKVGTGMVRYVVGLVNSVYDIINKSGVQMLIFLAGLQSINPAIYESCQIDGATTWETFWKITFPMISPMILVNTVYTVIDSFTSSDNQVMTYISQIYAQAGGNVRSAAMSWIYFLIVIAIIGVVSAIVSSFVFYQRRD